MFVRHFPKGEQGKLHEALWLAFIYRVNDAEDKFFDDPLSTATDDAGDYVETYPHAQVRFPVNDPTVVVIAATTDHGDELLTRVGGLQ